MAISREEFAQWVNDPVTCYIRNELIEQRNEYASLDGTPAEQVAHINKPDMTIEDIGLACSIRMAVVKGIELFTNTNELSEHIFRGLDED